LRARRKRLPEFLHSRGLTAGQGVQQGGIVVGRRWARPVQANIDELLAFASVSD
jgi:hypothetical protein